MANSSDKIYSIPQETGAATMSEEDELKDWLDRTAQEISGRYPNARTWLSWMVYLLNALEQQAQDGDPMNPSAYRDMLEALQDSLRNRMRTGGW
jgi:hypothetical protein